jgi:hypothetical protein
MSPALSSPSVPVPASYYYALYRTSPDERLGVVVRLCKDQEEADWQFIEPVIAPPRPMPAECYCLFTPKLKQSNMPLGIKLEDFQRIAHQLIVHGWELAERDGLGDISRDIDKIDEEAVPGLANVLAILNVHLPDMQRVLSRCFLEGQFAYRSAHGSTAVTTLATASAA